MSFDVYNALLFKALADRRDIQDSNRIVLVAGMATGSPMMKMLFPFTMLQQAEETSSAEAERDDQNSKLKASAASIKALAEGGDNGENAESRLTKIKAKVEELLK